MVSPGANDGWSSRIWVASMRPRRSVAIAGWGPRSRGAAVGQGGAARRARTARKVREADARTARGGCLCRLFAGAAWRLGAGKIGKQVGPAGARAREALVLAPVQDRAVVAGH